ncbi:MAG TPA: hypothetical protein VEU62_11000 [Bryobacterales bacterium]|nr:hypothetical protein [Bryobacterales bacterium]
MGTIRIAGVLLAAAALLRADVKTEEKSQMHFEGMMGRMMGMFGGKAMREGTTDTVAVKGSRKMTVNDTTGRIVDLDEEKVYELDVRAKTYKVETFDELRRRMQEAQERARQQSGKAPKTEPSKAAPPENNMQIDFDLKESGQKKNINGYDCREVVMTVTVRQKDKTLEQGGGMVMTSHEWLGPKIAAMKEIADFDRRYAEKMAMPSLFGGSADQMAMAMAMYPTMKDAIGKFQAENVNMDGTPILTTMTMEAVKSPEQMAQEQQQKSSQDSGGAMDVTSVRGMLGGLGRRAARKKMEQQQGPPQPRATVFTVDHELVKVAAGVAAADVSVPAGFKQK